MKNMKHLLVFSLCLFAIAMGTAGAESRVALIIANGKYANFSSLAGPLEEADILARSLRTLGFEILLVKDASLEAMRQGLDDLVAKLESGGGVALFHYGGHGVQVQGKNYLIPSDAAIPDERKLSTRALDLDEVMSSLESTKAVTSLVFLDACRNNPLPAGVSRSASRGLTVVERKPRNSVVVYAAEAGTVAEDGLFTPILARKLLEPGLSVTEMLMQVRKEVVRLSSGRQVPGEYSQLLEEVFLNGARQAGSDPGVRLPAPDSRQMEKLQRMENPSIITIQIENADLPDGVYQFYAHPDFPVQTVAGMPDIKISGGKGVFRFWEAAAWGISTGSKVTLKVLIEKTQKTGIVLIPSWPLPGAEIKVDQSVKEWR